MHIMFAEDIGGWLIGGGLFFGGLGASVLALIALFPASKGVWPLTIGLIAPAVIIVVLATCWLAQGYFLRGNHDREEIIENYVQPWFVMAFLPLVTSLLACLVLWFKRRKQT